MLRRSEISRWLAGAAILIFFIATVQGCKMKDSDEGLPRNQELPLFKPRRVDFPCHSEVKNLPPVDAEAQEWFIEARSLEDPSIAMEDRDYKRIVRLTRQAADRRHWMAMLNLASMYLEGRDPSKGIEDAVKLVEDAMQLGIPAAFDRMGTYYQSGIGVAQDSTRAYAFWQRAAELGSPLAMNFLAEKLNVGPDSEGNGYWANIPVATKMLECAVAQGHGSAAYWLHYLYVVPRAESGRIIGSKTSATKERALKLLHEGVKFGCEDCANSLAIEFGDPLELSSMIAPYIDKARAERYDLLGDALGFNASRRFPNLDRILPLPPAKLPPWDGTRDSLLRAAIGITPPQAVPGLSAASKLTGRGFLAAAYSLRKSGVTTSEASAPFDGYWQPRAPDKPDQVHVPGLYRRGESFDTQYAVNKDGGAHTLKELVWEHSITIWHNPGAIEPRAPAGLTVVAPRPLPLRSAAADALCPVTGVWQPWLPDGHPLQATVNQFWRQSWLREGEPFPQPERAWLLNVPAGELTWHLMESEASTAK